MKKLLPLIISFLFVMSLTGTVILSFAAEDDEVVAPEAEEPGEEAIDETAVQDFLCGQLVNEVATEEIAAYQVFLTEYFQNIEDSSDQVVDAMTYFRYVEDAINTVFDENKVRKGAKLSFDIAFDEFVYCQTIRDDQLRLAKILLQSHSIQSANSKRTFLMIDGMKELNANMDDLADDFVLTFPAVFESMSNKLPCYARECISF